MYVYYWDHRVATDDNKAPFSNPLTEAAWTLKDNRPLSSFAGNYTGLPDLFSTLLTFAKDTLATQSPAPALSRVPVFLGATAGMRLLTAADRRGIMLETRRVLSESGFQFKDTYARIISGEEEALFGWISVNYLKNTLDGGDIESNGNNNSNDNKKNRLSKFAKASVVDDALFALERSDELSGLETFTTELLNNNDDTVAAAVVNAKDDEDFSEIETVLSHLPAFLAESAASAFSMLTGSDSNRHDADAISTAVALSAIFSSARDMLVAKYSFAPNTNAASAAAPSVEAPRTEAEADVVDSSISSGFKRLVAAAATAAAAANNNNNNGNSKSITPAMAQSIINSYRSNNNAMKPLSAPTGSLTDAGAADADETWGAMDLGGASTQLIFTPSSDPINNRVEYLLPSGRLHNLYGVSHLNFGINSLLRRLYVAMVDAVPAGQSAATSPCFNPGLTLEVTGGNSRKVNFTGSGDFDACEALVLTVLNLNAECLYDSCSINGAYMPAIPANTKIVAFSTFPALVTGAGLPTGFNTLNAIQTRGRDVTCKANWDTVKDTQRNSACMTLAYVHTLLGTAYGIAGDAVQVSFDTHIDGQEVSWTPGTFSQNCFVYLYSSVCT